MNDFVLDASAVLAVLQNEPGKKNVELIIEQSVVGRVNISEILTTLINKGMTLSDAVAALDSLRLTVVEFDRNQSEQTASLRNLTKHLGLSLGDRACIALAIQENATAVTADRNWATLDVCPVQLIR